MMLFPDRNQWQYFSPQAMSDGKRICSSMVRKTEEYRACEGYVYYRCRVCAPNAKIKTSWWQAGTCTAPAALIWACDFSFNHNCYCHRIGLITLMLWHLVRTLDMHRVSGMIWQRCPLAWKGGESVLGNPLSGTGKHETLKIIDLAHKFINLNKSLKNVRKIAFHRARFK